MPHFVKKVSNSNEQALQEAHREDKVLCTFYKE